MATKIKGIFKSLKYIAQIFVVKEREMEIGYPTDVKHVAHIGWDGHSGSGPSWMNEFKAATDFSTSSLSERRHTNNPIPNPVTTRDFEESTGNQATQNIDEGIPSDEIADVLRSISGKRRSQRLCLVR